MRAFRRTRKLFNRIYRVAFPLPRVALEGETAATEEGIKRRIRVYATVCCVFFVIFFPLHFFLIDKCPKFVWTAVTDNSSMTISLIESMIYLLAILIAYARFAKKWIRVTGLIYCASTGYIIAYSMMLMYIQPLSKALVILAIIAVLTLAPFLFVDRLNLEAHPEFARAVSICYIIMIFIKPAMSLLSSVFGFATVDDVASSNVFEQFMFIAGVIMADCFLVLAIQRCRDYVAMGVEKRFEWLAAFIMTFTVLDVVTMMLNFSMMNMTYVLS